MSNEWEVFTRAFASYWDALPLLKQLLHVGTLSLLALVAVLFWTPLGNRRLGVKCMVLAVLLHVLAWGFIDQYDLGSAAPSGPAMNRIRLKQAATAPAKHIERLSRLDDPRTGRPQASSFDEPQARNAEPDAQRQIAAPSPAEAAPPVASKTAETPLQRAAPAAAQSQTPVTPAPAAKGVVVAPRAVASSNLAPTETPTVDRRAAPTPSIVRRPIATIVPDRTPVIGSARSSEHIEAAPLTTETAPSRSIARAAAAPAPSTTSSPTAGTANESGSASDSSGTGFAEIEAGSVVARSRAGSAEPVRRLASASPTATSDVSNLIGGSGTIEPVAAVGSNGPVSPFSDRTAPNRLEIVTRRGGSARTEKAVADALAWLAAHQDERGSWDCDGFHRHCPSGSLCSGPAIETGSDHGVTGLALLAFLGAGHTHRAGDRYADTVGRGLNWLISVQLVDGDLRGGGRIYSHAMATLALTEAYALSRDERLRRPAQKAIDWLVAAQHSDSGGWRYAPGQYGDTSVFGWAVLALRSAESAGLQVPKRTWAMSRQWLALVSSGPNRGLASYRPEDPVSHAMTAEALVCRQVLGLAQDDPAATEAADYLLEREPSAADYHVYYWYYGTLALFQQGGPRWERWNERLTKTLLDTQELSGHQNGSWEPQRPFGIDGGRVFSTAASVLCLEVYYRYLPMYGPAK